MTRPYTLYNLNFQLIAMKKKAVRQQHFTLCQAKYVNHCKTSKRTYQGVREAQKDLGLHTP